MISDPSTVEPTRNPSQPLEGGPESGPRRPGRRERRSQELRDRIYRAAQALFLEYGFAATTVSQIAAAADVAQATFFNHFQSKSAILGAMTGEVFAHLESLVSEVLSQPGAPQDRIQHFARRVAEEILAVHGLAKDVMLELHQIGVQSGDIAPHLAGMGEPFERLLRGGQQDGTVRDDLDAEFLAEFVIGALNTTVTNWLIETDYPLAVRLDQTASLLVEAIEPRHGDSPGGSSPIPEPNPES